MFLQFISTKRVAMVEMRRFAMSACWNKRTGTVAALVFLDWNGIEIAAESGELAELTLAVTAGTSEKPEIAAWFESHVAK